MSTTRFPLILDKATQRIRELPVGDSFSLEGGSLMSVQNIIPETHDSFDLGSDSVRWKDLYLSGNGSIQMDDGEIVYDDQDGFIFTANGQAAPISLDGNTTDDLSEGTGNLYFTTGRIDDHLTGGTGVNYDAGTISIGQSVDTTDDVVFNSVTATESVDTKFLNFDIPSDQYPVPPSVGGLQWNLDEGTLELGLNGTDAVLKIGQQTYYRVSNKSGSGIAKGTLVQFAGTVGQSGRLTIVPWDASVPSQFIMGITTETIPNDEDGFVIHFGKIRGINTTGTPFGETWANGDIIYAGVTGGLTNQKPEAPNTKTIIAAVISAHASVGTLFVRPTFSSKLDDDDLVEFTSTLIDNDIILFNGDNARFENVSLTTEIVTEDASNLYFTETRARNSISVTGDLTYNPSTGVLGVDVPEGYDSSDFDTDFGNKDTDDLSEGTGNLYFTTGRIDDHLTGGTGVDYDTGMISIGQSVGTEDSVQFNSVSISADVLLDSSAESTSVAATETTIAQFAASEHVSAKFIVGIKDTVTGDSQVSELLVTHDGTDAFSTEYGVVFTGSSALASFVVDIDAGNVRLRASTVSANETVYTVSKTLLG